MKKNISINISGIIFHIEEDGYEELKGYLESVSNYFSSFDDSEEIVTDIESRIAEIFLSKLNEGKQVITHEDVQALIATMGSVEDFQAQEEGIGNMGRPSEEGFKQNANESKKLFRDSQRKLLGGVSSGLAHYFGIDPLWVRLIIFLLAIGTSGIIVLAYVVLWVALPESGDLEDDKQMKKMFRNPENKVLGGVANGVASYFGVDVAVIRLLFVLSIFLGGTGIIAYVILWLILPEARSITEKVQMQGEPVTLSNIESNIKQSLKLEEGEENLLVKVLLFPFRLVAALIKGLSKVFGPFLLFLVEAIRVVAGIALTFSGVSMVFVFVVILGVLLGLMTGEGFVSGDLQLPLDMLSKSLSQAVALVGFLAFLIPAVALILVGVSIIAKRKLVSATVGWSLFGIWFASLITLSFLVPPIIYDFSEEGMHTVTNTYQLDNKTAVLQLREAGLERYGEVRLEIRGYDRNEYKLVKEFESQGRSRRDASENAKMVNYEHTVTDSVFTFDSNISFKEEAVFRGQQLRMTLYVPYQSKFVMDSDLAYILRNTLWRYGYDENDMEGNTWMFSEAGLMCLTCTENVLGNNLEEADGKGTRQFDYERFSALEVGAGFIAKISKGSKFAVSVSGERDMVDEVIVRQEGKRLFFEHWSDDSRKKNWWGGKKVTLKITMPSLNEVALSEGASGYIEGFEEDRFSLGLSGNSYAELNIEAEHFKAELSGASKALLVGKGIDMEANIKNLSRLQANDYQVSHAEVRLSGNSEAEVFVDDELEVKGSIVDKVKNWGKAKVARKDL